MPESQFSESELRFVVLLHRPGQQSERTTRTHFDWMFESDGMLRTWATPTIDLSMGLDPNKKEAIDSIELECEPLANHRLAYLEYEGDISRGRGTVIRQTAGTYQLLEDRPDCFRAALCCFNEGELRTAEVKIYRSFFCDELGRLDESRESWRLRFSLGW